MTRRRRERRDPGREDEGKEAAPDPGGEGGTGAASEGGPDGETTADAPDESGRNAADARNGDSFLGFVQRVLFLIFVIALLWFLYHARAALLMGLAAVILAVVLGGLALRVRRVLPWRQHRWAYRSAVAVVALSLAGILAGFALILGPRVTREARELRREIPEAIQNLQELPFVKRLTSDGGESFSVEGWQFLFKTLPSTTMKMASGMLQVIVGFSLVVFLALFLAGNPSLYQRMAVSLVPPSLRKKTSSMLRLCGEALWRWLIGQAFAMLLIALLTTAGLFLIGMEFALTLGLLAGLFQFVPYVGPILSAVPALLVAMTVSPQMALLVAILYFFIQVVEGNLVTPLILQREAYLPPAFTLLSTVAFGMVFGPIGIIIATPTSVLVLTVYRTLYQGEILGAEASPAGGDVP